MTGETELPDQPRLDPADVEAAFELGCLLTKEGRVDDGAAALRRAIELDPDHIDARRSLAFSLYYDERKEEAQETLRAWLSHDPASSVAKHMLAAFGAAPAPGRAANDYIRLMFDRAADEFDEHIGSLGYRAPELVVRSLSAIALPGESLSILDAGCGTGLCGPGLRGLAAHLAGVDLSPQMIEKAKKLSCYDRLVVAELTEFLQGNPDQFDVVVTTDTFNYFGDLAPPFSATATALRESGRFAFTVEREESSDRPFKLNWFGRYSHSEPYVRDTLETAGFLIESLAIDTLRTEGGTPVMGLVVVARKR